jgi:hypothetical protein
MQLMSTRFGATMEQVKGDLIEGIEGKDVVGDTLRAFRNAAIGLFHGVQGIIPSIANAFNGQEYEVVERDGPLHGTRTAFRKILETKGFIGKVSAVIFEATDGPVDDVLALTGGAKRIVVPVD